MTKQPEYKKFRGFYYISSILKHYLKKEWTWAEKSKRSTMYSRKIESKNSNDSNEWLRTKNKLYFEIKSGISWSKVHWHCLKFIKLDLLLLYASGDPF